MMRQPTIESQPVIADTLQRPHSVLTRREQLAEVVATSGFIGAVAAIWLAAPPHAFALVPALVCVVVLVLAMRIRIDTPFGFTVPTQLAFVPLVFSMPLALVPLAVVVATALARVPDVVTGEMRIGRLVDAIGNSWYSIGPVAVFVIAGVTADQATPALLIGALAAQFTVDFAIYAGRLTIGNGTSVSELLPETWVSVVDAALSGIGLLVAEEIHRAPIAALAPLPLLGLVALFARERRQRLESLLELNDAYRHARDEAVEASNMKSAFLRNVSHEIRTPMNGVLGMNELLLDTELNSEQRYFAEQVANSSGHMLTIINDILDISKIETGHLELDLAEFDLYEAIDHACAPARSEALTKNLALTVEVDPQIPRRVRGDGTRMRQVLMNLATNAVKFTAEGSVAVHVTPIPTTPDGVRFAVSDTGIGIDPAAIDRMFEPFMQADVSTTREYGGNGLGLAIAKELVDLMGGDISATSALGAGSRFWVDLTLPKAAATMTQAAREHIAHLSEWRADSAPALVLVVEDSPVNRLVAVRVLERRGYHVHVVNDGREALQALATQRYDAVLMDCQMPDIDGYEATRELRRRERGTSQHTPVIAMTAHAMTGDRERCLAAGMDDYVTKPVRSQILTEVLQRWIGAQVPAEHHGPPRMLAAG
jgi:signal transduction histidine kinase/ActR/RegA family two-component response regulator